MKVLDCLIIGFYEMQFAKYVQMLRSMGERSGSYRDLNLAFIEINGRPLHSMDVLNEFRSQITGSSQHLHNSDFLWPVITYLTTFLRRQGFTADYVNLFHLEPDHLNRILDEHEVSVIAVTTTLYVSPEPILEILRCLAARKVKAKIVVGGPYIHNQARQLDQAGLESIFQMLGADIYVIEAEGETALGRVVGAVKTGQNLAEIENIAFLQDGRYLFTSSVTESNGLSDNMVDYSYFPPGEFQGFLTLRTAKSCPFSCSFCGFPARSGKYTYLDLALVEKELDAIKALGGIERLSFIDDTFNVPKARFKEMLRMILRKRYGFRWNSYLRSDHVDEEALDLMAASGCEGVFLGVESGSDTILRTMNKTSRRNDYLRVIPMLKERGIVSYASLIVGFPGETLTTLQETVDLLEEAKPDFFRTQLWYCDPTTPIWSQREAYGVKGSGFQWTHDTMDAATACELIERCFLSVRNSTWLPQNGFELWSVFYLQQKGMTLQQIKHFVRCFNAGVKHKLLHRGVNDVPDELLRQIKTASCDSAPEDLSVLSKYDGYLDAERFWLSEFKEAVSPPFPLSKARPCLVEAPGFQWPMSNAVHESTSKLLLSAFLAALSGRCALDAVDILVSLPDGPTDPVIPMRFRAGSFERLSDVTDWLNERLQLTIRHRMHVWHILAHSPESPVRNGHLHFAFAFAYGLEEAECLHKMIEAYPELCESLGMLLVAIPAEEEINFTLSYSSAWLSSLDAGSVMKDLNAILARLDTNPTLGLVPVMPPSGCATTNPDDMEEVFQF